jgi:dTDP-4-dehydrorhamnose 3,5-epimerase-like enzyme
LGRINEFIVGERNQGLVVIPPGVYHGWKNIGAEEAGIVSMPSCTASENTAPVPFESAYAIWTSWQHSCDRDD